MAWIDIIKEEGIEFYSVSDSVEQLHETFFAFWMGVSPGMILIFIVFTAVFLAGAILFSVYRSIKAGTV